MGRVKKKEELAELFIQLKESGKLDKYIHAEKEEGVGQKKTADGILSDTLDYHTKHIIQ